MDKSEPKIIQLPKITDPRGNLSIIEQIKQIPYEIKRVHWVYDVPGGFDRGGHAYFETEEFFFLDHFHKLDNFLHNVHHFGE